MAKQRFGGDFDLSLGKPKIDSNTRAILSQFYNAWKKLDSITSLDRGLTEDEIRNNSGFPSQNRAELVEELNNAKKLGYVTSTGGYWCLEVKGQELFIIRSHEAAFSLTKNQVKHRADNYRQSMALTRKALGR